MLGIWSCTEQRFGKYFLKVITLFNPQDYSSGWWTQQVWLFLFYEYQGSEGVSRVVVNIPPANAGDLGSITGAGRSPGVGKGNPLQYSCLGNPMNRGAWQATVHGATKNQTWLRDWAHTHTHTHTQCSERFKIAHVHMVNTSKSGLEPLTIVPKSLYKPSAATESGLRPGDHSFN